MGLLDGVEKFLEERLFRQMQVQFEELIGVMRDINSKLGVLIQIQREKKDDVLGQSREV